MINGRVMTFTDADVQGIKDVMRLAPAEPTRASLKPPLSDYQLHKSLVELTRKKKNTATVSPKMRKLVLQRSKRPSHKKLLKKEFGE
jgi:hypothetical protein